jgi:hypothetical protein
MPLGEPCLSVEAINAVGRGLANVRLLDLRPLSEFDVVRSTSMPVVSPGFAAPVVLVR